MQYRYNRQPKNEDAFEEFCLVLVRDHWSLPTLERYGHRGERQHGVDLLDTGGASPLRAVQCKHHDPNKTLPPKELEAEVEKARSFPEKIGEYLVLTTAKKSVQAQRIVRAINTDHAAKGLFVVQLMTWDDIERIIDNSPAAQEFLGVQAPQAMRALLRTELQPVHDVIRSQGDDVHGAELDEVKKHLDGEVQLAVLLLGRLRKKSWDRMSARHRSRWCTLLADTELRQGDQQKAAQLLIEAKSYQPDDDGTVSNEIMAYELLGNRPRAFELAVTAIAARPHSGSIYATGIRTAPSFSEFSRLFDNRPDHLREHPEVWVAAATRDDLEASVAKTEATARRAIDLAPDDARGWFALGGLLLRTEFAKIDPEGIPTGDAPTRARIEEARECCTKVVELAAGRGIPGLQATALIRRATATAYLGDIGKAHKDIEEARRAAPTDAAVLMASARMAEERGNHDEEVQLLRQVVMRQPDDEARFLLGISLWNRNGSGDRAEAVDVLVLVALEGNVHVEPANELAVEGMIVQGRPADARAHLEKVESRLDGCLLATARARIEAAEGRPEEASARATEAVQRISPATSRATLRKLGRLLFSFGRLGDSLSVWERLLVDGEVNDDTRSVVECAGRLGRHGRVLEVCASARNAGLFDGFLIQWELRLLDRYDPDAALGVLEEFIRREPANKSARLHLVHLALRLGKMGLAESQIANLASVTEADAEEGAAVVAALAKVGRSADAIAYAYDLLRRHFQDHHAHRAFRDAVMFREQKAELEAPTEACPGVAVCLAEEGASGPRWFVLEDSPVQATGVEDEIRAESAFGQKLVGKKVGEEVALSEGPGVKRTAVVRELVPKHVFRVRDVWDRWQYRFPDHQEMWMVRVAQSGDDDKPDFSSLFELAKEQHRRRQEAEGLYAEKLIPIWLFGQAVGKTEMIYALGHIASTDGLVLRCCVGTPDEYADAVNALKTAAEVVLDVTALTTLLMLDELSILEALGKTAIITHSTMVSIRAFVEQARTNVRSEGSMGANEDGPLLFITSLEGKRAALDAAERFQKAVEENCRVVGCPALADVDPADRKLLEDGIGASALESAVLGAGASRLVWTDDGVVALIGREKFGTKRIWTQAVLRSLNEQGIIPNSRYATASARLLGWQYMFTSVNPEVMRAAGNQAEWRPDRWPLKQAIGYLSLDVVHSQDAALLSAMLVAYCYLDAVLPETRRVLLQAAAEGLAKRTDAESVVPLFGSVLRRAFGLNLAGQQDAVETFEAWRGEQLRRFVPVRT
jgi:tetratricopeptide (TPR) repeat protein